MNKYAHHFLGNDCPHLKFRGQTGQIDYTDTIISMLSETPGLRGIDIANALFDKETLSLSHGYVYKVLKSLTSQNILARSGAQYYLIKDALEHDMKKTLNTMNVLKNSGIDNDTANFLVSGVVMAAEKAQAEAAGYNYDPMSTEAAAPATQPVDSEEDEDEGVLLSFEDDNELPDNLQDPFENITDDARQELKDEADRLIAADIQAEKDAEYLDKIKSISTAQDLLGQDVYINPHQNEAKLIGTILELRATGLTFLVTDSQMESVPVGTVLPFEYSEGVTYKLLV